MTRLIFGCGYLGLRVAKLWRQRGEPVAAVTRSPEKAAVLAASGLQPLIADLAQPSSLAAIAQLRGIQSVLFSVGYDRTPLQSIGEVYAGGLARVLAVLPDSVQRFLYISSTGVYGQVAGDVVDETSPCRPTREGGQACLAAEQLLQQSKFAGRTIRLRLAGIYGPDRIPRAKELKAGMPIAAPSQGFLNLIHVDDAAQIVLLAEEQAVPPKLYCVSDGHPVVRSDYYAELARLLHAPPPQFVAPTAETPAAQRAGSDKRISNVLLMSELRPEFHYPSYREGLRAIVGDQ